ncbi:hypothetical protein CLU79DRAFT_768367 [Phycomyces nitens]|nr:hypothetical protein CLU79DRAFT_768367 [Phycomyces nitens]
MDDMYQYAASAVNENKQVAPKSVPEEEDVILKAFTNFGWGQRFTSIVDTVKKQSEALVEVTKKDLQEFAQVLREDLVDDASEDEEVSDDQSNLDKSSSTIQPTEKGKQRAVAEPDTTTYAPLQSIRDNLNKINTVNLESLKDGLTNYIQTLPAHLPPIKLPDNIDLTTLKEEASQGTRFAEQYIQKFGTEVIQILGKAITVVEPSAEEQVSRPEEAEQKGSEGARVWATRKEGLLAALRTDPDNFLKDPAERLETETERENEKKVMETFKAGFNATEYTDEIARLLEEHSDLREMMDKLVPVQVSYALFWQRYFYYAWKIDQDEQKRQWVVKEASVQDNQDTEFKWDYSDDEDNEKTSVDHKKDKGSDTDYSTISAPHSTEPSLLSPPLKANSSTDAEEWVKPDTQKKEESDSDSDWE